MNDLANQRQLAGPWSSASQGAVSVCGARDSGIYSSCPEAGAQFPKKLGNQGGRGDTGSFCRRYTVCVCDGGLVLVAAVGVATVCRVPRILLVMAWGQPAQPWPGS